MASQGSAVAGTEVRYLHVHTTTDSRAEAMELARAAAALAAQTDLLSEHADTLLELAHVLAAAGQATEAREAATEARDLYQRKGNLPGAQASLRYLTQSAST